MKLNGLIQLTLILILAYCAEAKKNWTISVNESITAVRGSSVTINCTFRCPSDQCNDKVSVYWKKRQRSSITISDNDKNVFILHENNSYVLEKYRGKTELVQHNSNKDCSLKINNVTEADQGLYVRLITKTEKFSFYGNAVSVFVIDRNDTLVVPTDDTLKTSSSMYIAIFVPIALIVIIAVIAGIFFYIKHRRTQPFTREESGYYANFSRASSNDPKSDASCKKNDKLPEVNDIDDPVYINVVKNH
ncbi:uncharacterized protein LOC121513691 isoform X2 [Cheilinus undulatus]|uniref:uncharacterized protein LOC121513691 isoform X2 n=1 Tax=Cheilinus undulatus TaxID=241271 RepID=UPI001BD1D44C|nr:uncharacterized protein LOC121513691 isoform X2 [Cheilinus undulatus]